MRLLITVVYCLIVIHGSSSVPGLSKKQEESFSSVQALGQGISMKNEDTEDAYGQIADKGNQLSLLTNVKSQNIIHNSAINSLQKDTGIGNYHSNVLKNRLKTNENSNENTDYSVSRETNHNGIIDDSLNNSPGTKEVVHSRSKREVGKTKKTVKTYRFESEPIKSRFSYIQQIQKINEQKEVAQHKILNEHKKIVVEKHSALEEHNSEETHEHHSRTTSEFKVTKKKRKVKRKRGPQVPNGVKMDDSEEYEDNDSTEEESAETDGSSTKVGSSAPTEAGNNTKNNSFERKSVVQPYVPTVAIRNLTKNTIEETENKTKTNKIMVENKQVSGQTVAVLKEKDKSFEEVNESNDFRSDEIRKAKTEKVGSKQRSTNADLLYRAKGSQSSFEARKSTDVLKSHTQSENLFSFSKSNTQLSQQNVLSAEKNLKSASKNTFELQENNSLEKTTAARNVSTLKNNLLDNKYTNINTNNDYGDRIVKVPNAAQRLIPSLKKQVKEPTNPARDKGIYNKPVSSSMGLFYDRNFQNVPIVQKSITATRNQAVDESSESSMMRQSKRVGFTTFGSEEAISKSSRMNDMGQQIDSLQSSLVAGNRPLVRNSPIVPTLQTSNSIAPIVEFAKTSKKALYDTSIIHLEEKNTEMNKNVEFENKMSFFKVPKTASKFENRINVSNPPIVPKDLAKVSTGPESTIIRNSGRTSPLLTSTARTQTFRQDKKATTSNNMLHATVGSENINKEINNSFEMYNKYNKNAEIIRNVETVDKNTVFKISKQRENIYSVPVAPVEPANVLKSMRPSQIRPVFPPLQRAVNREPEVGEKNLHQSPEVNAGRPDRRDWQPSLIRIPTFKIFQNKDTSTSGLVNFNSKLSTDIYNAEHKESIETTAQESKVGFRNFARNNPDSLRSPKIATPQSRGDTFMRPKSATISSSRELQDTHFYDLRKEMSEINRNYQINNRESIFKLPNVLRNPFYESFRPNLSNNFPTTPKTTAEKSKIVPSSPFTPGVGPIISSDSIVTRKPRLERPTNKEGLLLTEKSKDSNTYTKENSNDDIDNNKTFNTVPVNTSPVRNLSKLSEYISDFQRSITNFSNRLQQSLFNSVSTSMDNVNEHNSEGINSEVNIFTNKHLNQPKPIGNLPFVSNLFAEKNSQEIKENMDSLFEKFGWRNSRKAINEEVNDNREEYFRKTEFKNSEQRTKQIDVNAGTDFNLIKNLQANQVPLRPFNRINAPSKPNERYEFNSEENRREDIRQSSQIESIRRTTSQKSLSSTDLRKYSTELHEKMDALLNQHQQALNNFRSVLKLPAVSDNLPEVSSLPSRFKNGPFLFPSQVTTNRNPTSMLESKSTDEELIRRPELRNSKKDTTKIDNTNESNVKSQNSIQNLPTVSNVPKIAGNIPVFSIPQRRFENEPRNAHLRPLMREDHKPQNPKSQAPPTIDSKRYSSKTNILDSYIPQVPTITGYIPDITRPFSKGYNPKFNTEAVPRIPKLAENLPSFKPVPKELENISATPKIPTTQENQLFNPLQNSHARLPKLSNPNRELSEQRFSRNNFNQDLYSKAVHNHTQTSLNQHKLAGNLHSVQKVPAVADYHPEVTRLPISFGKMPFFAPLQTSPYRTNKTYFNRPEVDGKFPFGVKVSKVTDNLPKFTGSPNTLNNGPFFFSPENSAIGVPKIKGVPSSQNFAYNTPESYRVSNISESEQPSSASKSHAMLENRPIFHPLPPLPKFKGVPSVPNIYHGWPNMERHVPRVEDDTVPSLNIPNFGRNLAPVPKIPKLAGNIQNFPRIPTPTGHWPVLVSPKPSSAILPKFRRPNAMIVTPPAGFYYPHTPIQSEHGSENFLSVPQKMGGFLPRPNSPTVKGNLRNIPNSPFTLYNQPHSALFPSRLPKVPKLQSIVPMPSMFPYNINIDPNFPSIIGRVQPIHKVPTSFYYPHYLNAPMVVGRIRPAPKLSLIRSHQKVPMMIVNRPHLMIGSPFPRNIYTVPKISVVRKPQALSMPSSPTMNLNVRNGLPKNRYFPSPKKGNTEGEQETLDMVPLEKRLGQTIWGIPVSNAAGKIEYLTVGNREGDMNLITSTDITGRARYLYRIRDEAGRYHNLHLKPTGGHLSLIGSDYFGGKCSTGFIGYDETGEYVVPVHFEGNHHLVINPYARSLRYAIHVHPANEIVNEFF